LRGTFIIDDTQTLKHSSINDLGVGRNIEEYLRLVKVIVINNDRPSNSTKNTEKFVHHHGNPETEP
jgi:alkyl hydroperoxide reductase subunit AhpC